MRVTLVDSRDSFTFNLAQAFGELGAEVGVVDGPLATPGSVLADGGDLICLGPGPRGPSELPALIEVAQAVLGRRPALGVCLGLQALVRATGGRVGRAVEPLHGREDPITHDGTGLFADLPSPLTVMRYHSLVALDVAGPWRVTARDSAGQVMALEAPEQRAAAVQFHPESIGTRGGLDVLAGALRMAGADPTVRYRPGAIPAPPGPGSGAEREPGHGHGHGHGARGDG